MVRRLGLATLLVAGNVALVLLAAAGVAYTSERLLVRLVDEQALARATAAGVAARAGLARASDELATAAHLLAEQPQLGPLLDQDNHASLAAFLEGYRDSGPATGCALALGERLLAQTTPALPWAAVPRGFGPADNPALLALDDGSLLLVAAATLPSPHRGLALAARRVDPLLVAELGRRAGLPVTLVSRREALSGYGERRAELLAGVVSDGEPAAERIDARGAYFAFQPLRLASGQVAAVLETRLPTTAADQSVAGLRRTLLVLTALLGALAIGASVFAARRLARPVRSLTTAVERVGRGDLTTQIPLGGLAEVDALARSMEDMRRRLLRSTDNLRQREGESAAVLSGIAEGVFAVDRDRRLRYLNPQAATLLGVDPRDAIGRFCGDLLHPRLVPAERPCEEHCPIVHARFRGATQAVEQLALAAGSRAVVVAAAPPEGERQVVLLRDETAIEAGRRMREALFASLSHELKTPLAAQLASLEMLRERLAAGDTADSASLLAALERGTLRLTRLIDNLLESVRIEAGRDSIRKRPVALDEVIEEAVQLTAPLLAQRDQSLELELPSPLPPIVGDAGRLVQVLVNLLANAHKFAPEGTPILLGGDVDRDAVRLWVEDRGPGLPPGDPAALFHPFVRSPGEEPEQGGVGLGLWVVRSIVERHGGRVEARDTGGGSRFTISLPRDTPATR